MVPVDVELCVSGREITEPRISPDGSHVAFVASRDGTARLLLVDIGGGAERELAVPVQPRSGRGMGGGCFDWHPSGRALVYAATDGALWRIGVDHSVDPSVVALPQRGQLQCPTFAVDGGRVAYVDDMATVHIVSDDGRTVRIDDGGDDFCLDPAWSPRGDRLAWHGWRTPSMPWDESRIVEHIGGDEARRIGESHSQVQQPRYAPDGTLWCLGDRSGWLNVCPESGAGVPEPFEHGGPTWGPGQRSFAFSPDGTAVAFSRNEGGFGRLGVADLESGAVHDVARGVHGSLCWRAGTLVAVRSGARTPTQLVAYDTASWQRTTLARGPHAAWASVELVEPVLFDATGEDGVVVHARLYRSPHPQRTDRLLCWVHGGPTDQWQVSFMPRIAYWVSRGWNVLVPDHRGSTGHGRAYQQALRGRWGDLDVSDTAALCRAAQAEGWGTPATTVAMGASAGGFTVLNLVGRQRGLVAAAVVSAPVSDLVGLAASTHRFEAHYNDSLLGSRETSELVWRQRSPITVANAVDVPVLVLHGEDDPVVPVAHSRAFVAAVVAAGGDATLVVYPGEGHGLRQAINQRDEYERVGRFLEVAVGRAGVGGV